jgi:hypothetical protein
MLIEQYQLIHDYRPQGEQLRALQALHGHLQPPFKDVFEQTIEGFNSLRPKFVQEFSHLHTAIAIVTLQIKWRCFLHII